MAGDRSMHGILALVCSLVGILMFSLILNIVAVILGIMSFRDYKTGLAGLIIGSLNLLYLVLKFIGIAPTMEGIIG